MIELPELEECQFILKSEVQLSVFGGAFSISCLHNHDTRQIQAYMH